MTAAAILADFGGDEEVGEVGVVEEKNMGGL